MARDVGYSGKGAHKNNPASEAIRNWGPIPRGRYTIGNVTNSKGDMTIVLIPSQSNQMFGRTAFRIHGDSRTHPGEASEGCIVIGSRTRSAIIESMDRELVVE
ncbi:tlde1 domain-containing protein [Serratia microhaemolytica]|uniref:tlde1 domain-containing protein n=1 Tax=Serratia microhaemolytica TaxID=2675110 RepID=UPI001F0C1C77|nr:tlde1 domain-containing protein [Serratia microhaemolytica]